MMSSGWAQWRIVPIFDAVDDDEGDQACAEQVAQALGG
jgi:hypothetical protein